MASVIRKRSIKRRGEASGVAGGSDYNPGTHRDGVSRQERVAAGDMQRCGGGCRILRKRIGGDR